MLEVDLVVVAVVEVVWAAALSAVVSLGGVISGVLLGTTSETLLEPPQPANASAAASAASTSAARAIRGHAARASGRSWAFTAISLVRNFSGRRAAVARAGPCAARRWDSR